MGYAHLENFYRDQDILMFKQVYAMEKLHGTSAHLTFADGKLTFFSGGESHPRFVALFDQEALLAKFKANFPTSEDGREPKITVYGEAYGGKQQGMSHTYGQQLKFAAFDVMFGDKEDGRFLSVPDAADAAGKLGLEFVHYELVSADVETLNNLRDADSVQAVRNGVGPGHVREGIVIRPPVELRRNNGARICAKHKGAKFSERQNQPQVMDAAKLKRFEDARAVAEEFVVEERLTHVLDHLKADLQRPLEMTDTTKVIAAMVEDVTREAKGEILENDAVRSEISRKAAGMFRRRLGG